MEPIRDEVFADGVCIAADVWDVTAGTYAREEYGVVVATRAMTADEIAQRTPAPDPRADLIAQVEAATTVAKLRAAVLAAIDAGALA